MAEYTDLIRAAIALEGKGEYGPPHILETRRKGNEIQADISLPRLFPLVEAPGGTKGKPLHAFVPVRGTIRLTAGGKLKNLELQEPTPEELASARSYVQRVALAAACAGAANDPLGGRTHEIGEDKAGRLVLRRIGFTALK